MTSESTEGRLVYAVGDIHGRKDLLQKLVLKLANDAVTSNSVGKPLLVFLGDYIDRGPDSRGVINIILGLKAQDAFDVHCLQGNHEESLLQFLEDPEMGPSWSQHGGSATLASYGVAVPSMRTQKAGWDQASTALAAELPPEHLNFYLGLPTSLTLGDYFFVHAGVRPGVPLQEQSDHDLIWSRGEFLRETGPFEKIIVHGHTPVQTAYLGPTRISVDTGAYATGNLSAVRLDGDHQSVISTSRR